MGDRTVAWDGVDQDRFYDKVTYPPESQCVVWAGARNSDGYGLFYLDGKSRLAHQVALMFSEERGELPEYVMHLCDNRACVRDDHLRRGTHRENVADMDAKGRRNTEPRPGAGGRTGEDNHQAKLTWSEVLEIRSRFERGASKRGLARAFGVSRPVIAGIVEGKSWIALHGPTP